MAREFPGRRLTVEESIALKIRDLITTGPFDSENAVVGTLSYPDRANTTQDYRVIGIREKTWLLLVPAPKLSIDHAQYIEITCLQLRWG